jgi:hypothetical protein
MPFLWLAVPSRTDRGCIERNGIALLACRTGGLDQPSASWLGRSAWPPEIQNSGLWNVNHTADRYEPEFLQRLAQLVNQM